MKKQIKLFIFEYVSGSDDEGKRLKEFNDYVNAFSETVDVLTYHSRLNSVPRLSQIINTLLVSVVYLERRQ